MLGMTAYPNKMTFETRRIIPADHPSLAGHFPGNPIVPGVVVLEEVAAVLGEWRHGSQVIGIPSVKFIAPIKPGQSFVVGLNPTNGAENQIDLPNNEPEFNFGDFHLKPLARFSVDARLLHSKIYRYDRGASLVPIDLAVGWGPMSDQQVLDQLQVSQSMRFFWYEYKMPPPIAAEQIVNHATNIHIIPSTPELAAHCKSLRSGALLHLSGELVQATGPQIGTWRSSLSRTDSGNGACELLYLEDLGLLSAEAVPNKSRLVQR